MSIKLVTTVNRTGEEFENINNYGLTILFVYVKDWLCETALSMSRLGLVVRRSAGKRKDAGSTPHFGSSFSSKIVIYGHCLVTLPCTVNETL